MRYKNNPLNIRYNSLNNWIGQDGSDNGFCTFQNIYYGCRAAAKLAINYIMSGYDTIESFITRWAPPSENNTQAYIDFVLCKLDDWNVPVTSCSTLDNGKVIARLLQAMSIYENGCFDKVVFFRLSSCVFNQCKIKNIPIEYPF